ncbi:MAG: MOSC domain-containing protein [Nitrospiraceae bacterium]|nr:MAG: MOSC domain-containing protein [Nitrospiraceae bacterium]
MTGNVIEALNIGLPRREEFYGREVTTGICKMPVRGPLRLNKDGFEGDGVADLKHHGGQDKAVCVYSIAHYPYWENILETKLPPAAFGENLSVSGLLEDDVCIGDIFQAGTALVQVSQPRQPCKTLAARYGRNDFVKLVVDSGRTGFYFRVLEEGIVERGPCLILKERPHPRITVSFANRVYHYDKRNCEAVNAVLAVQALSESWRQSFLKLKESCL